MRRVEGARGYGHRVTLDARLPLRLAEGTGVEVRIAGIASRAVATAVDLAIATIVIIALSPGMGGVLSPSQWWLGSASLSHRHF